MILTQLKGGRSVLMIGCSENIFHRNGPYYSPWNSLEGLLTHCKRLEVHLTIKVPPTARNLMDIIMCRLIQGLRFIQSNLWEQGQGPYFGIWDCCLSIVDFSLRLDIRFFFPPNACCGPDQQRLIIHLLTFWFSHRSK